VRKVNPQESASRGGKARSAASAVSQASQTLRHNAVPLLALMATTALYVGVVAQPAPAAIHEIVAAWCSGNGALEPPGITDRDKQNFAMPVVAGGVVSLTPYLDGLLIDINFDAPQAKVVPAPTGPAIVQIGPGLYLERFVIDPNFPAFANCMALQALSGLHDQKLARGRTACSSSSL
jgi:hypothetical protein